MQQIPGNLLNPPTSWVRGLEMHCPLFYTPRNEVFFEVLGEVWGDTLMSADALLQAGVLQREIDRAVERGLKRIADLLTQKTGRTL